MVTDGAADVVAVDATTIWRLNVPRVNAINPVGSGDSFNAAMSLALMHDDDVGDALRKGVAAGSANALTISAASIDPMMASALEDDIRVSMTDR